MIFWRERRKKKKRKKQGTNGETRRLTIYTFVEARCFIGIPRSFCGTLGRQAIARAPRSGAFWRASKFDVEAHGPRETIHTPGGYFYPGHDGAGQHANRHTRAMPLPRSFVDCCRAQSTRFPETFFFRPPKTSTYSSASFNKDASSPASELHPKHFFFFFY